MKRDQGTIHLVRGPRVPAEYVDGEPRKVSRRPDRSAQSEPVTSTNSPSPVSLSVVRLVNAKLTRDRTGWHDFIDEMGGRHRSIGTAVAFGSYAIDYVSAPVMTHMLAGKFPNDYAHPKRRSQLFRKVQEGLGAFIKEEGLQEREAQVDRVARDRTEDRFDWYETWAVDSAFLDDMEPTNNRSDAECALSAHEQSMLETYRFGPATLETRGISFDSTNGTYGLNLDDELLHDEYAGFRLYLDKVERLGVHALEAAWVPRPTMLTLVGNTAPPSEFIPTRKSYIPSAITFAPPTTLHNGIYGPK